MGTISISLPIDGTTADVADYNTPLTTIVNEINGGLDGDNIADDAVDDALLDYPRWWQEIGKTTLGSAGDTISVTSLPARKYLLVMWKTTATGGNTLGKVRFNNDSAANYANRQSDNGAADGTQTSSDAIFAGDVGATANPKSGHFYITNDAAVAKLVHGMAVDRGTSGAGNAPAKRDLVAKWENTADQITRIDMVNDSTGDFATGSQLVVLGHD